MNKKIKAAVLGCTGYTGLELVNILKTHPNVILSFLGSQSYSGEYINKFDKRLKNVSLPKLKLLDKIDFSEVDVVFLPYHIKYLKTLLRITLGKVYLLIYQLILD